MLHFKNVKSYEEKNNQAYLDELLQKTFENLKKIDFAPNISGIDVPTDYRLNDENVWQEGRNPKIIDQFIFKEKGVQHLEEKDKDKVKEV